jgi:hypothetical protein
MGIADKFRRPKASSEESDGAELLARARLMERNCHFEAALASYRDIAARYSHLPVGKEAQTAFEAFCPKQAEREGDEVKKIQDPGMRLAESQPIPPAPQFWKNPRVAALQFWEDSHLGCWSIITPILAAGVTIIWLSFSEPEPSLITSGLWALHFSHGFGWIVGLWTVASMIGVAFARGSRRNGERWPLIATVGLLVNIVALGITFGIYRQSIIFPLFEKVLLKP